MVIAEKGINRIHKEQSEEEIDRDIKKLLVESETKVIKQIQAEYCKVKEQQDYIKEEKLSEIQTSLLARINTKAL